MRGNDYIENNILSFQPLNGGSYLYIKRPVNDDKKDKYR
jgi:hypothetical protein